MGLSFSKGARARRPLSRKFSLTGGKGQVCGYVVGKQLNLVTSSSAALCAWGGDGRTGVLPTPVPSISPIRQVGSVHLHLHGAFWIAQAPHPTPRTPTPVSLVLICTRGSQACCRALQLEEIEAQEGCDIRIQT